ncbi:MAG: heme-dependent oxidative N-demethylase family protein, partial [Alphaproteobacteria bacterium]
KTTELNQEPIVEASLLAQEDFCILEPDQDGLYRLSAACVCFPARWDLPAKLDRNLSQIHGPVPGFEAKLTAPLNRMFANLKVDQPVWRQNWSLETDTALHQPGNHFHGLGAKLTASEITQKLWLRSEYQTLRRMEKTHAIVFTIRNFIWPLTDLTDRKHRSRLKTQIETMCPEMSDYKSISGYKNAILEHLGATISL